MASAPPPTVSADFLRRLGAGSASRASGSAGSDASVAGALAASSRPASISRALWASTRSPYLANSGEALAAASTSSAGPMRERGARRRVRTTGVGTPSSSRIVTMASPMPSCGRVSSRS